MDGKHSEWKLKLAGVPHGSTPYTSSVVNGAMGCGQKSFKLVSGFLAKGRLPRVSRQSRQSLMIRVIMI